MSIPNTAIIVTTLLNNLQGAATRDLVRLTLDYILRQPLRSIVPLSLVHNQTLSLLTTIVDSEQTQTWMVEQIEQLRTVIPDGTPSDFVPAEIQEPLRNALKQEVSIDTELIHQLMDHSAMEQLFHAVLSSVLLDFTETIKTWTQTATSVTSSMSPKGMGSGFGRLKKLGERVVQNSPLGQISQIIEQQAQQKILLFLDQSIANIIRRSASEIGKPENRTQQAEYRIHVLDVLLTTDNQKLIEQITVLEPTFVVDTVIQTIRATLSLPAFQDQLMEVLENLLDSIGDQSVHDFLIASDLGDDWRGEVEEYLTEVAKQVVSEPKFVEILTQMLSAET